MEQSLTRWGLQYAIVLDLWVQKYFREGQDRSMSDAKLLAAIAKFLPGIVFDKPSPPFPDVVNVTNSAWDRAPWTWVVERFAIELVP